jgi:hypothetical protein
MVLNHIAAIFLFSGPVFYIGLLMAIDPAGIAGFFRWMLRFFRVLMERLGGLPSEAIVESENAEISRRLRTGLRVAGMALLVFGIVI